MRRRECFLGKSLGCCAVFLACPILARAGGVGYQGELRKDGDLFAGTASFKFTIMDDVGATVWSNDASSVNGSEPIAPVDIEVNGGIFNLLLGGDGMEPIDAASLRGSSDLHLRVWVDTGDGFEQLTDQPIASSMFAMQSEEVDQLGELSVGALPKWDGFALTDGVIAETGGNVSIGAQSADGAGLAIFMGPEVGFVSFSSDMSFDGGGDGAFFLRNTGPDFGRTSIVTNNDEHLTVLNTGNVGIGTTNPGADLHVSAGASGQTPSNLGGLFVENNGISNSYYVLQTATAGGGKSFTVTNAGNVGIGDTNPESKLTVAGEIESTQGGVRFPDGTVQSTAATGGNGFWSSSGGDIYSNNGGDVGIGTMSPSGKLHLDSADGSVNLRLSESCGTCAAQIKLQNASRTWDIGADASPDGFYIMEEGASQGEFFIAPGGNVGIGTMQPTTRLEVSGGSQSVRRDYTADVAPTHFTATGLSAPNKQLLMGYHTGQDYGSIQAVHQNVAYSALALQPGGGNVGVGTASPGSRLTVAGTIQTTQGGIKFPDGTVQVTANQGGDQGPPGQDGIHCWDLNENGVADSSEDTNGDGAINVLDCRGSGNVCVYDGVEYSPGMSCGGGFDGECCVQGNSACIRRETIVLTCGADGAWSTSLACTFLPECGITN